MERPRHTIFCTVLTLIAIIFLFVKAHDATPTLPPEPLPSVAHLPTATARNAERTRLAAERNTRAAATRSAQQAKADDTPSTTTVASPKPASTFALGIDAIVHGKRYVKEALLTPSQASFSWLPQVDLLADGQTYRVSGTVDSHNAFGAMLQQSYRVHVRFVCDPYTKDHLARHCWEPTALQIGNQVYQYAAPTTTAKKR